MLLSHTRMPNEVLQHIAQCLQDGKAMHAFLSALPDAWLTPPMVALATLYKAVRSDQLADTNMTWLWPELDMRNLASIPGEFAPAFHAYATMLPRLQADLKFHRHVSLPRDTPVARKCIVSTKELATALNDWAQQLQSLGLTQDPDALPTQHLCNALPRLPKLRHLDVLWQADAHAEETTVLLHALSDYSNVTELWLRYDSNSSSPQWTATEVTALVRWLQANSVTAVGLVDVPIGDANAKVLARALLQSQTLKSLHVDDGQLPRTLFSLGLSLPTQLESLNTYVRHIHDVLGLTQTIAGSNLRTLVVGTVVPLEWDAMLATNLMNAITSLPRLRHLFLDHTALPLPSVVRLSERLPSLTTLRLYDTNLDDAGAAVLARALPSCRHLETLGLIKENCTYVAAELLAKNIPYCPSLKTLNLDGSPIGSRGLVALLPVVRCLDTLSLPGCGIDDGGAAALCRVMDSTDHLYKLDLSCNLLSKVAVKRIIRALSKRATRWGAVYLCDIIQDEGELDECMWKYLRNESWCYV
ncbi:hypothetical protein SPRG_04893 [Saprolegnia parasitica CBS 223.65]|uniref:RNI-like protein n=1 Tax=Saprolegnia parasitica (strain CBS 223.65) TaxID=695850 RepID=A0A067CSL1_SAPPC|nr:hypothetical protein SPRG_04893 [Saprolegnia parasitica CBS 223.65]KDO29777.1 hypothetical protein SPRG_04893 [Saprolegnia parasitica CBS 223.65]|eukprot:XP_012199423.1 hypothetical protein SPRG_04893 [Saprolegnia parasitica CBS 223.65]